jgi:hypothetical protein
MKRPEPARPDADEYVVCRRSAREALFACGADPGNPSFLKDGAWARRFPSVGAALTYRDGLARQAAEGCAVFQLLPNGLVVPPEE